MLKLQTSRAERLNTGSRRRIYLSVLLLAVILCVVAQLLTAYVFSIWDRSRVEQTLAAGFKRQVHLGQIRWRMGFRGLAFDTEEITIQDKDGSPFFHANKTTILFGIVPLLHGQLRIKHLDMQQPQAWLKRLTRSQWNFSDLPQADTFSKFADCKIVDGSLHLIDERAQANNNDHITELNHVQFETRHLFGKIFWPFDLRAQLSQPEGLCEISLSGNGRGSFNDWSHCHYNFELIARNLAPANLSHLLDSAFDSQGVVDLKISGSGVPADQFDGIVDFKTDRLWIKAGNLEALNILHTAVAAKVLLNKNQISWQELNLKIGASEFKSKGKLDRWLSAAPVYEAELDSRLERLEDVLKNMDAPWLSSKFESLPKDFAFSGKINLSGSVSGNYPKQHFNNGIVLHDSRVELKDRHLVLNAVEGSINSDQSGFHMKQLKASLNKGSFEIGAELTPDDKATITVKGSAIAAEDLKALIAIAHIPSWLDNINIHGNIKTIDISISGSKNKPKVNCIVNPDGLIIEGQNKAMVLKINAGTLTCNDDKVSLNNLSGVLGGGNFLLNGNIGLGQTAPSDIMLNAQNLDLASLKALIESLGFANKFAYASLFQGQISGIIKYDNQNLILENVTVKSPAVECLISAKIIDCAAQAKIEEIKIENAVVDLKEAQACFTGEKNPQPLRQVFVNLLTNYGISSPQGKITGRLFAENRNKDSKLRMNCVMHAIQFIHSGQTVSLDGNIFTEHSNDLNLQSVNCSVNKSAIIINGRLSDLNNAEDIHSRLKIEGQVYYQDMMPFFPNLPASIATDKPIKLEANLSRRGSVLSLGTSRIVVSQLPFQAAGTISGVFDNAPVVDLKTWIHEPTLIQNIIDTFSQDHSNNNFGPIAGTLKGGMHISGPIANPKVTAGCRLFAAGQPKFAVTNLFGHLKMVLSPDNNNIRNPVITFNLDSVSLGKLPVKNISGTATYFSNSTPTSINIDGLKANIANGNLTGSMGLEFSDQRPFHTDIKIDGLDTDELTKELGGKANELKGKADIAVNFNGNGKSWQELIKSLSGSGSFQASNGHIDKLRQLQVKLEEANVLEQGIIGFRLSNVMGIAEQQENGAFISTNGKFQIANGIVQLDNIAFNGEELQLQSAGTFNLNTKQIALHTQGDLTHVGEEGSLGKVAALTSIATLGDIVEKNFILKHRILLLPILLPLM